MRLGINSVAADVLEDSVPVARVAGGWQLDLERRAPRPVSANGRARATGPTVEFPATHSEVVRLAQRATVGATTTEERIQHLTRFVHDHLEYRADAPPRGVLETLDVRAGDCTEFADLLTTLARALDLPARTVTGLAYAEAENPGFYLHTWTEIASEDRWHPVDPTFGITRLGALHIPFPAAAGAHLRAYAAIPDMRFQVIDVEYPSSS